MDPVPGDAAASFTWRTATAHVVRKAEHTAEHTTEHTAELTAEHTAGEGSTVCALIRRNKRRSPRRASDTKRGLMSHNSFREKDRSGAPC